VAKRPPMGKSAQIPLIRGQLPPSIPDVTGGKSAAANFAAALMNQNPAAIDMLQQSGVMDKDKPSLANMFMAETYSLAKRLGLAAGEAKKIEPILESYRQDLRRAHRFELDDDFVRYITEISSKCSAEKLLSRLGFATLPYDTVWIEFNLMEKVRVMRTVHGIIDHPFNWDDVADRLGLIIHRLSDTAMTVEIVCETHGNNGLIGTTICYFFSLTDHVFTSADAKFGCKPLVMSEKVQRAIIENDTLTGEGVKLLSNDKVTTMGAGSLWGYSTAGESMVIEKVAQMRNLALPQFLMRHGVLGTGRMKEIIQTFAGRGGRSEKAVLETITNLMLQETIEFTGMMRWIVLVLAALNEVPIETRRIEPKGQMRVGLTGKRRYLDYHRVTLRVPKTKPLQFIEKKLRNSTRRHRAHEVIAHWRKYDDESNNCAGEHDLQFDYDEGFAVCSRCRVYLRYIREHVRGDPSLGWIRKEYVIKKEDT
jgi:hypothetical protein